MDVETTTIPPRAGTIKAQVTPEVVEKVRAALETTRGRPRAAVAIGGAQEKEGTARSLVEAVMERLAELDPPVHVRTHIRTEDTGQKNEKGEPVKQYRGAVSLTPDGEPSRKRHKNGEPATPEPAADAPDPAPTPEPAAAPTGRRGR